MSGNDQGARDHSDLRNGEVDPSFAGRDGNYIVPGYGTREIHLGQTREELIRILGLPSEEFDHRDECEFNESGGHYVLFSKAARFERQGSEWQHRSRKSSS